MIHNPLSSSGSRKRVRMRDVANRCGVSISTVSLVLSGDVRIPEDTARRVLQAVKAMEYRPSVVARSLARRVSRTIGVVLPEFAFSKNKAFYYQALQGIHSQTQPAGYKMVVEAANRVFLARRYYLRLLKEQSTDGMIYMAASLNDSFLKDMEKEPYPFVLVGSYSEGVDLLCSRSDDEMGAKLAADHLIKLGHRRIAHVAGLQGISYARDREKGYRAAMEQAGLAVEPGWVVRGDFDMEVAERLVQDIINEKVTAVFAGSDVMAYGVLRGLRQRGVQVPNDMAVVGMDDLEMSAWVNPSLTTVRYDIHQISQNAARYIIQRVQTSFSQKSAIPEPPKPEMIVRTSCGSKK